MADILGIQPVRAESSSETLTTANLASNASYTSPWQSSSTGQKFITVTAYTGTGQNGSFVVEFTEDTAQTPVVSSLTYPVAADTITVSPVIPVPTKYYRIVYTNGSTLQTSFELVLSAAQSPSFLFDVNGNLQISGTVISNVGTGTRAISGTVTANAGTGTFTVGGSIGTLAQTSNGLKVDGSAVTQPISGTVTITPSGTQNSNVIEINGTSLGSPTAAGTPASGNVLGVQGITGGVALPISGTVTSNAGTGFPSATSAGTSGSSLITVQGSVSGVSLPVSSGKPVSPLYVAPIANTYYSYTGSTNIAVYSGTVDIFTIVNTSTSPQTQTISLYDGTSTTLGSDTLIYSAQLGASQIITLNMRFANGLVVASSGSITNPVIVTYTVD